jgi:hypothetical protein
MCPHIGSFGLLGPFSETGLLTRASTNVHNYDEILLTKQNCVTEQHISMVFFFVSTWIIGDGPRAH